MLKTFIASALILTSTLSLSAPITAQPQQSVQKKTYELAHAQYRKVPLGYVCTEYSSLNLRTAPSLRSRVITQIPKGKYLTILRSNRRWHKVSYQGKIGWVSKRYVCIDEPKYEIDAYVSTFDRYGYLNLRSAPSLNSRVIRRIPNGSSLVISGDVINDEFIYAEYNGTTGYVSIRYIRLY